MTKMKTNIILVILIALFYSCQKCADCTQTITYTYYTKDNNGNKIISSIIPVNETEEVCGTTEIKYKEGEVIKSGSRRIQGFAWVDSVGSVKCVNK